MPGVGIDGAEDVEGDAGADGVEFVFELGAGVVVDVHGGAEVGVGGEEFGDDLPVCVA